MPGLPFCLMKTERCWISTHRDHNSFIPIDFNSMLLDITVLQLTPLSLFLLFSSLLPIINHYQYLLNLSWLASTLFWHNIWFGKTSQTEGWKWREHIFPCSESAHMTQTASPRAHWFSGGRAPRAALSPPAKRPLSSGSPASFQWQSCWAPHHAAPTLPSQLLSVILWSQRAESLDPNHHPPSHSPSNWPYEWPFCLLSQEN